MVDNTFIVSNSFFEVRQELRQTAESVGGQRIYCLTKSETKSENVGFTLCDSMKDIFL